MFGHLFHTLKGTPGWSRLWLEHIDVGRVIDIGYHKRLFMICDKDRPYALMIKYDLPITYTSIAPTMIRGKSGFTAYRRTRLIQNISCRYKTEMDVIHDIKRIKLAQQVLQKIFETQSTEAQRLLQIERSKQLLQIQ